MFSQFNSMSQFLTFNLIVLFVVKLNSDILVKYYRERERNYNRIDLYKHNLFS